MSLIVRTLSDRVFEIVRDQIVSGRLPDRAPIRQDALATELGVSKIPLREALARLEQDGLITGQPNRGYFVRPMSQPELDEIFELRLLIEPSAAAKAATDATDDDRAAVQAAFDALDSAAAADKSAVPNRNREFHVALTRSANRLITTQVVERLAIMAERYVHAHLEPAGRGTRAHQEHGEQLEAYLARDAKRLGALLDQHIRSIWSDLKNQFGANA